MTIKELAKLANTSPAAVSLVLNGKWQKMVRRDIAEKIQKLSKQHNFTLNIAGKSLVMQKKFRVAVCASSSLIAHPVMGAYSFHEQLGIISAELSKSFYSLDIVRLDDYENKISELNCRLQSNCDGAIFLSPPATKIKSILKKLALKIHYIVVDSNLKNSSFNYVYTDMASSVKNIISALIRKGHKKIAIVRGESSDDRFQQKLKGYKQALSMCNIKYQPQLVFDDYIEDSFLKGSLSAQKVTNLSNPPTAVLCTDNSCGIGFIQYANKNGINIPGDIELIGFGDEAMSMFSSPRLTYLKRPVKEMAKRAVDILLDWIEGKNKYKPTKYEFKEELVIQETAFFDKYTR